MSIKLQVLQMVLCLPFTLLAQHALSIEEYSCPNEKNSFRAISVFDENSLWLASDQSQVWFYNKQTGWRDCTPSNYPDQTILWRDIHAYSDSLALILSAGSPGIILRTENAGNTWKEVYRDDDPKIFFDAFDFKKAKGQAFSDAQGNYLGLIESRDSGKTWQKTKAYGEALKVIENQGGFAASGTCLRMMDEKTTVIVLGGPAASFLKFNSKHSISRSLPLDHGAPSQGAFSIDFKDAQTYIAVGGDYRADSLSRRSVALSHDGGQTWKLATDWPEVQNSYWSCVSWKQDTIVLCSRFKSAISYDNGASWQNINQGFYTYEKGWFSGPGGRIGRLNPF